MKAKSVLRLLKATKRIALWSAAMTGLAVTGLAQTTPAPEQPAPAAAQTEQTTAAPVQETVSPAAQFTAAALAGYRVEGIRLGPWDELMEDFAFSSDGHHFAYISSHVCQKSKIICVVVDGKEVEETQDIRKGTLALSPDGKHVAFASKNDRRWTMVIDGQPGAEYDEIEIGSPVFSPDSKRVAFVAKVGGRYSMVVDGQTGAEYDEILNPARAARLAVDQGEMPGGMVAGGIVGSVMMGVLAKPWYMAVKPVSYELSKDVSWAAPIFSPDSSLLAYVARNGSQQFVVVDGQAGPESDVKWNQQGIPNRRLFTLFSPDSKRFAYAVKQGGLWSAVLDGQKVGLGYEESFSPFFSPDGKHIAYAARRGKQWSIVVDGNAGAVYDNIFSPRFSPNNKRFAYAAQRDKKWSVLLDGQPGAEYEIVSGLTFSPDSKHLAYFADKPKKKWVLVVDGQEGPEQTGWLPVMTYPIFSPDSKHVAYVAEVEPKVGSKKSVWLDGRVVATNYTISTPIFSPDSQHLAYLSAGAFSVLSVEIDGKVVEGHEYILNGSPYFDPDGTLEFLEKGKETHLGSGLYRVRLIPTR